MSLGSRLRGRPRNGLVRTPGGLLVPRQAVNPNVSLLHHRGIVGQAGGGGAPAAWQTIIEDDFEGLASGWTELHLWTPSPGGGNSWVFDPDSVQTTSMRVDSNGHLVVWSSLNNNRLGYNADTGPTSADQRCTAVIGPAPTGGPTVLSQLRLRIGPNGESYCAGFYAFASSMFVFLERHTSDTAHVDLDNTTVTFSVGDTMEFSVVGNALSIKHEGVEICSATDNNITAPGDVGVGMGYGDGSRDINSQDDIEWESLHFEEFI